jgi:hypothetical protein
MYFVKQEWFFLGLAIFGILWIVRSKREFEVANKIHPNVVLGLYEGVEIWATSYKDPQLQKSKAVRRNHGWVPPNEK